MRVYFLQLGSDEPGVILRAEAGSADVHAAHKRMPFEQIVKALAQNLTSAVNTDDIGVAAAQQQAVQKRSMFREQDKLGFACAAIHRYHCFFGGIAAAQQRVD